MLWLLRHAEAADGKPDDERPLTERGIGQAQDAGGGLAGVSKGELVVLLRPSELSAIAGQRVAAR